MSSMTMEATVQPLCFVFSAHGFPEELILDNGPQRFSPI